MFFFFFFFFSYMTNKFSWWGRSCSRSLYRGLCHKNNVFSRSFVCSSPAAGNDSAPLSAIYAMYVRRRLVDFSDQELQISSTSIFHPSHIRTYRQIPISHFHVLLQSNTTFFCLCSNQSITMFFETNFTQVFCRLLFPSCVRTLYTVCSSHFHRCLIVPSTKRGGNSLVSLYTYLRTYANEYILRVSGVM